MMSQFIDWHCLDRDDSDDTRSHVSDSVERPTVVNLEGYPRQQGLPHNGTDNTMAGQSAGLPVIPASGDNNFPARHKRSSSRTRAASRRRRSERSRSRSSSGSGYSRDSGLESADESDRETGRARKRGRRERPNNEESLLASPGDADASLYMVGSRAIQSPDVMSHRPPRPVVPAEEADVLARRVEDLHAERQSMLASIESLKIKSQSALDEVHRERSIRRLEEEHLRDRLRLAERRAEDFSREADRGRQQVTELKEQLARARAQVQAGGEDGDDARGAEGSLRVDLERAREEARQLRDMLADAEERAQAAGEARGQGEGEGEGQGEGQAAAAAAARQGEALEGVNEEGGPPLRVEAGTGHAGQPVLGSHRGTMVGEGHGQGQGQPSVSGAARAEQARQADYQDRQHKSELAALRLELQEEVGRSTQAKRELAAAEKRAERSEQTVARLEASLDDLKDQLQVAKRKLRSAEAAARQAEAEAARAKHATAIRGPSGGNETLSTRSDGRFSINQSASTSQMQRFPGHHPGDALQGTERVSAHHHSESAARPPSPPPRHFSGHRAQQDAVGSLLGSSGGSPGGPPSRQNGSGGFGNDQQQGSAPTGQHAGTASLEQAPLGRLSYDQEQPGLGPRPVADAADEAPLFASKAHGQQQVDYSQLSRSTGVLPIGSYPPPQLQPNQNSGSVQPPPMPEHQQFRAPPMPRASQSPGAYFEPASPPRASPRQFHGPDPTAGTGARAGQGQGSGAEDPLLAARARYLQAQATRPSLPPNTDQGVPMSPSRRDMLESIRQERQRVAEQAAHAPPSLPVSSSQPRQEHGSDSRQATSGQSATADFLQRMQGAAQQRESERQKQLKQERAAAAREEAAPFATTAQQASRSSLVSADVEKRLLQLNQKHDAVRDELSRFGSGAGRTRQARERKRELEREMAENEKERAAARLWLRKYGVD